MPVNKIDPKAIGLAATTVIEEDGEGQLVLVIDRKSRLIMADGKKILAKVEKIRASRTDCQVSLRTSAPVCSKTVRFLADHNIEIVS